MTVTEVSAIMDGWEDMNGVLNIEGLYCWYCSVLSCCGMNFIVCSLHLSTTWPSATVPKLWILFDGFNSRRESIVFGIHTGGLLTQRAQTHFAVSFNKR